MEIIPTGTPKHFRTDLTADQTFVPAVPPVIEGRNRLVITTEFNHNEINEIFDKGVTMDKSYNIDNYARGYGSQPIYLVANGDFQQSEGYFLEGHDSNSIAILIDMPEHTYREFRSLRCLAEIIPREFIRGVVDRSGNFTSNPNYNPDFTFTPELGQPPQIGLHGRVPPHLTSIPNAGTQEYRLN